MDTFYMDQLQSLTSNIKSEEQLANLPSHVIKYFLELLCTQSDMPSRDLTKLLEAEQMMETKSAFRSIEPSAFSSPECRSSLTNVIKPNPMDISQLLGMPKEEIAKPSKKRKIELPTENEYCDDIKYLMGKRGGCQVLWKGHRYTRDRTRNEQTYWACVLKRPPYRCKGRISTRGSYVTSATGHNHVINPSKVAIATLTHEIKSMARNQPEGKSHDIVMECLDKLSGDSVVPLTDIPRIRTLKKMCQRESKKLKLDEEPVMNEGDSELRPNISISQSWNTSPLNQPLSPHGMNSLTSASQLLSAFSTQVQSSFAPPVQSLSQSSFSPPLQSRVSPLSQIQSPPLQSQVSPLSCFHPIQTQAQPSFPSPAQANRSFSPPTLPVSSIQSPVSTGHSPICIPAAQSPISTAGSPVKAAVECEDGEWFNTRESRQHSLDVIEMLYKVRAAESSVLEQDIENTRHQLSVKEDRIKSLKGEVSKLDVALKIAQEGLRKSMMSSDEKVDKSLIKNFFTQYVTVSEDRKQEVLKVISAILGYTDDELREIELSRQHNGKWLPALFAKSKQTVQPAPVGESFSELFVSFLETEANKAALPPRSRTTSQHSRPVSTPPVMGHARTSSSASSVGLDTVRTGSPLRSASPVGKSNRRSPVSVSSQSGISDSPPPSSTSHSSVTAAPLVPSTLAELLSSKQAS